MTSAESPASFWGRITQKLEDSSDESGPVRGTLGAGRIGMIWLAANLVVTTLLTGTLFVPGITWLTALTVIILGTVVGGSVLVLVGNIGTRTGLSTMALTRGSFGLRGSLLPVAANVITLMGWSWVQAMLAGVTVNFLVHEVTGFSNPVLFSVLCQTLVVVLAIFGHEGISRVEPWLAVVIIALMVYVFTAAFAAHPISEFAAVPADSAAGGSAVSALDVVISTAVSWTVLSAEFNRLARSQRAGVVGSGLGYLVSTVAAMSLGATVITYVLLERREAVGFDPTVLVAAFGAPLAIVVFLSVMATNTMVVYGMVSSVVNCMPSRRIRFLPTALVLGIVSILGSTWLGLLDQFTSFLGLISSLFIPVFAIMLVDYYLVKRGNYDSTILRQSGGKYWYTRGVNPAAIIVWLLGAGISLAFTLVLPATVGATIPTFLVSAALYLGWAMISRGIHPERTVQKHLADGWDSSRRNKEIPGESH